MCKGMLQTIPALEAANILKTLGVVGLIDPLAGSGSQPQKPKELSHLKP